MINLGDAYTLECMILFISKNVIIPSILLITEDYDIQNSDCQFFIRIRNAVSEGLR
jgi:hypothetical protein